MKNKLIYRPRRMLSVILALIMPMMSANIVGAYEDTAFAEVVFGTVNTCTNMSVTGKLIPIERDGRVGGITSMAQGMEYVHFNVSDSLMYNIPEYTPVDITVEYYDQGTGSFALNYDSHNPDPVFGDWNDSWAAAEIVRLTDTKQWMTYTYHIEDMLFTNRTNEGGDFRIGIWDPYMNFSKEDVILGSVRVEKSKFRTPIKFEGMHSDRTGNVFSAEEDIILSQTMLNKTDEKVKAKYLYSVCDKDGKIISEDSADIELEAKEQREFEIKLNNPGIYGIYSLNVTEKCTYSEETTVEYESAFSVTKMLAPDERNMRSGVCQQVAGAGAGKADEVSELMSYSGVGVIRDEIRWDAVELTKGVYKIPQDKLEKINTISESGADIMLILCFWNPLYDEGLTPYTDEGINAFANYAAFMAKELKGKVKYFEVWNEYNAMPLFNNGYQPPETYAKMLKETYKAIKAVNDEATVIGLDTGDIDIEFAQRVLDTIGIDYCDAVSFHPYDFGGKFREEHLKEKVEAMRALMRKYGEEKPIYFTEIGWPTFIQDSTELPSWAADSYGYTPDEQAATQILVHAYSEAYDLCELMTQYCLYDRDNDTDIESTWGIVNSWVDQNDFPNGAKPAYLSLAAFNDFTGKYGEFKEIVADGRFYAFNYYNRKYEKNILILQSGEGEKIQTFELGCKSVDIYDMYGNYKTTVHSDNGTYSLSVNEVPYYVMGNFDSFRLSDKTVVVTPDSTIASCTIEDTVAFEFTKHSNKNFKISVEEHENIKVLKNEGFVGNKAELVLMTDADAAGKEKIMIEVADEHGKVYYSFEHTLNIILPIDVKITAEEAVEKSATHWNVRVVLENMSNSSAFSGEVMITNPDYVADELRARRFNNLKPKEKQTFIFNLPEMISKRTMELEVMTKLDNGYSAGLMQQLDFATAVYTENKPVIDGRILPGEWNGSWIGADEQKDVKQISDWNGPEDLSFDGTLMWDEENLYFAAVVTDNIMSVKYTPQEASNMWRGDNIQFGLDDREVIDPVKKTVFTEIGLAYVPGYGDAVYRFNSLYEELPFSLIVENAQLSVKRYDEYTVYECAVPWSEIFYAGYEVDMSKTYHFSVLANDNDSEGRRGWIEYTSGIGTYKDVSLFGTLKFVK